MLKPCGLAVDRLGIGGGKACGFSAESTTNAKLLDVLSIFIRSLSTAFNHNQPQAFVVNFNLLKTDLFTLTTTPITVTKLNKGFIL